MGLWRWRDGPTNAVDRHSGVRTSDRAGDGVRFRSGETAVQGERRGDRVGSDLVAILMFGS